MGSSGGIRATVPGAFTAGGFVTGQRFITSPIGAVQVLEGNAGGLLTMQQSNAQQAAPSGTFVRLYTRVGTTGSKLVAIGSGGTEFTILDNIV